MYINQISRNIRVDPPVPVSKLSVTSSLPEGNWTFYANFGLLGLLISYYLSGIFFGWIFNSCKSLKFNTVSLYFYGLFAGSGYVMLHPSSFVNILMASLIMAFVGTILRIRLNT